VNRRAFSLVELTVVLLILAIMAGAVAVSARGPLRKVGIERTVDEIIAFDRLTRQYARQQDRAIRLLVDLSAGELRRTDEEGRGELGEPLRLASGYSVARLRLAGQDIASGQVAISCSALGLTPTYAVLLEGAGGRRQWVLVAGLSGQIVGTGDDKETENILAMLEARPHAD
jgi:prepilin-type N-terminal cleavage/methylation domain-containing protein